MLGQVEAGDIDLEDGVLDLMRLLANEGSLPAYAEEVEGELVFARLSSVPPPATFGTGD